jgi:hypothetical protein
MSIDLKESKLTFNMHFQYKHLVEHNIISIYPTIVLFTIVKKLKNKQETKTKFKSTPFKQKLKKKSTKAYTSCTQLQQSFRLCFLRNAHH